MNRPNRAKRLGVRALLRRFCVRYSSQSARGLAHSKTLRAISNPCVPWSQCTNHAGRGYAPLLLVLLSLPPLAAAADSNWSTYLGDKASSHYSTLKQITTRNVAKLEVSWTYQAGGTDTNNRSQIQCNPLIIDGALYGTTPDLQLFALDAASGTERWRFNPASVK